MVLCLFQLYWEVTRQQYLLQLAKMSSIHSIYQMVIYTMMLGMPIMMESASLGFCPSPKVSHLHIYLPSVLTAVFPKLIKNIELMPNFTCFAINCFTHLLALFLNPYDQQWPLLRSPNVLMDIFVASFMVSVHTLLTTWNKYCLHVLFRAGVQSELFLLFLLLFTV